MTVAMKEKSWEAAAEYRLTNCHEAGDTTPVQSCRSSLTFFLNKRGEQSAGTNDL